MKEVLSVSVICRLPLDVFVRRHFVCKQICFALSVLLDLLCASAYLADETCCCDTHDGIHMSPRAILPPPPVVAT